MKKIIVGLTFLLSACASILPTPNDFPPPPTFDIMPPPLTVIVEFPNVTVTPTFAPRQQPITQEKMSDARNFFLILYTHALSGDSYGIAENVKYPITVKINGATVITNADEFIANYDAIFNDRILEALGNTNEENLILLPEGIRVSQGEIWFNLFCMDVVCGDPQFLITQINP